MISKSIYLSDDKKARLDVLSMPIYEGQHREWQNSKRPVALIVPGGSYLYCSDRERLPIAFNFLSKGYQVFMLEYHVGDESDYPTPFIDLAKGLKYIKDNADEYALDINDITLVGFSAGGHLAGTFGALATNKEFQNDMGMTEEELKVHQMILAYPAINLKPIVDKINKHQAFHVVGKLFTTYEMIKDGKAQSHKDMPKAFVFHSIDDNMVPVADVMDYVTDALSKGCDIEFHLFNRGGHGYSTADLITNPDDFPTRVGAWMPLAFDWLSEVRQEK